MFKAITTKYFGPTNTRGSRIQAKDSDGNKVTVPYDHSLNSEDNHRVACAKLLAKMGWEGRYHGGGTGNGYVFVCENENPIVSERVFNGREYETSVSHGN